MSNYKRYLVRASSDNEHFNADYDFGMIEFSGQLLFRLKRLYKAFLVQEKRDDNILTWSVRDASVKFFSYDATMTMLGEEVFEEMNRGIEEAPFKLPDAAKINEEKYDVSVSDEMVINSSGVWWKIFPSHTEISVGSSFFPWSWFTQCRNCGLRRTEHARGHCLFSSTRYRATVPEFASASKNSRKRNRDQAVS